MVLRAFVASLALLICALPARAECPVSGFEAIKQAIGAAPTCVASADVYGECTYVTSGDIQFAAVAIEKCEGEFLGRLGVSARKTYARSKQRCEHKYARKSGTMYRSFEASCAVALARDYARKTASKGR